MRIHRRPTPEVYQRCVWAWVLLRQLAGRSPSPPPLLQVGLDAPAGGAQGGEHATLLFADEDQAAKTSRDPAAPAKGSQGALNKAATKRLPDASLVHSFHTLLDELQTIVRNTCRRSSAADEEPTFHMLTPPSPKQQRAYDLLNAIAL